MIYLRKFTKKGYLDIQGKSAHLQKLNQILKLGINKWS